MSYLEKAKGESLKIEMKLKVFLCYQKKDKVIVEAIYQNCHRFKDRKGRITAWG